MPSSWLTSARSVIVASDALGVRERQVALLREEQVEVEVGAESPS